MGYLQKFKQVARILIYLPVTIYFNLRYFPISQAIKLPVLLYRPKISGNGKYILPDKVSFGMIRLGFPLVSVFPGKGIVLENKGTVIFKGRAQIGGGSGLSIGQKGVLQFGDRFSNLTGAKIICYHKITLGDLVRLGWQTVVCDTDFHTMKSEDGRKYTKGYGQIEIESEVWVGSFCKIFKNSKIPGRCTIASNTLINKKIECQPYSLIYSGAEIKVKYSGYYRDVDDDVIQYR